MLPFENGDYLVSVTISIGLLTVAILIIYLIIRIVYDWLNAKYGKWAIKNGEIVDKVYTGATRSSGSGVAIMPNTTGATSVGVVSTSSSSPEEFLLFVSCDKEIFKVKVDMHNYYLYDIHTKVGISVLYGRYNKKEVKNRLIW